MPRWNREHVCRLIATCLFMMNALAGDLAQGGQPNRLNYLDSSEVWYPHRSFPKLVTPQWVGEAGVDCVVTLAIDDMRDPAKYEAYLRPILQRLKQIDGRAPVSIMTCAVKPDDPQLQQWLQEGLSLECHTADHPCPILAGGDIRTAKGTYDRCVDLLWSIPNNRPVAFRTPCCDSLNTVSPRLFSEIINQTTPQGHFLQLDSSVFTVYTADDPSIPRAMLVDADGREKFRKYIPRKLARGNLVHDGFVNLIENYPYPYIVQRKCWEFPCMVPSDWSANHLHKPNNPETVRDLKTALDITVSKQGVFNLVFHPHGWIQANQVIELIDHAVATHGRKVKFLTFKECVERLNRNLLAEQSLRDEQGGDRGVRLFDINDDGFQDVLIANAPNRLTRIWNQQTRTWKDEPTPFSMTLNDPESGKLWLGTLHASRKTHFTPPVQPWATWSWNKGAWDQYGKEGWSPARPFRPLLQSVWHDIDGDGKAESFSGDNERVPFHTHQERFFQGVITTSTQYAAWPLPGVASTDPGLRYVDLNDDGGTDLIYSDSKRFAVFLWKSRSEGWVELIAGTRGQPSRMEIPPIVREDGTDNGFFVRDRQLCWVNEGTDGLADFVLRIAFDTLIGDQLPEAKSPQAALQSMRVTAGYRVELAAHEPRTMDPVAMDWGPDGILWIAEMADYPRGMDDNGKPGGRIRFLQDFNGDGQYDASVLFMEDIPFPNGIIAWKKGVLVSAAPDVFYAEDTDNDGKADVKKVLFTGFAEGNQQHRANGFSRGLDNWLYMANGDSGGTIKVVGALRNPQVEEKSIDIRGRDIRIRPDTGEIEAVAGQSQFGRNRDDWGNWFGNNNSRPIWHYLLDDHYLRRNASLIVPNLQKDVSITPGAAPVFPSSKTLTRFNDFHTANRFTSACASMIYRDDLIGRELPGQVAQVFISEPVHNLVHREVMRPEGLSFSSQRAAIEQESEFLSSTDNWFRPTQIKTGPDGALYVADMYRLVIEHPQWIPIEWQRKLDLRAGQDKGRIWRVVPVDAAPRAVPNLSKLKVPDLVAALRSPNGWQRDMVQQLLIDRADPAAIPLLASQATEHVESAAGVTATTLALARLHSLCTLDGLQAIQPLHDAASKAIQTILPVVLADPHPGVRRHAVRICESVKEPSPAVLKSLLDLVGDVDPQVRLQLAYTLGEISYPDAGAALGQLAVAGPSPAAQGAVQTFDPLFNTAVLSSLNPRNLERVLAEVMKRGPVQTELLQQLLTQATALDSEASLVKLLNLATEATAQGRFQRWQYLAVDQFLISLERRFTTLEKWLQGLSAGGKLLVPRLETLFATARTIAADNSADLADRLATIKILGRRTESQPDIDLLTDLITPQHPPELQSAALASLARSKSVETARTLLTAYRSLAPSLRLQACNALLSRDTWREELMVALETRRLSPSDLDAASRQALLDQRSKGMAERAARILTVDLNSDRAKLVAEYLPTVRAGGDAQLGSQLFKKMCSQCHKLGDVGHAVGPDLVSLTDKSPDAMIAAVLDPNRAVETKFLTFTAITKAGVTHTGLIVSETAGSVTLRAAEGKEVTLLRTEIDELQSNAKSLMPEGLERDLKPADAAALISFIRLNVPLPAPKKFPGNEPRVVAPNADGHFQLTPYEAEIYGSTIVIEESHKNLGWWSSADDIVVWTIDVPAAGKYSVSWNYACEPSAAGSRLIVEAAGKTLTQRVEKTMSWDDYRDQTLGELDLPKGQVRITLKPASRPLPALGDCKSVRLAPIQ